MPLLGTLQTTSLLQFLTTFLHPEKKSMCPWGIMATAGVFVKERRYGRWFHADDILGQWRNRFSRYISRIIALPWTIRESRDLLTRNRSRQLPARSGAMIPYLHAVMPSQHCCHMAQVLAIDPRYAAWSVGEISKRRTILNVCFFNL